MRENDTAGNGRVLNFGCRTTQIPQFQGWGWVITVLASEGRELCQDEGAWGSTL